MRKLTTFLVIVLCLLLVAPPAEAKSIKKVAQTGLQFLKVDMLARSAGMGGAFTMAGSGADAMFYNPAGLSELQSSVEAFGSMTTWIADINYMAGAVAKDLGNWGTVGVSFINADYGDDIQGTRVAVGTDEGYSLHDIGTVGATALGVSFARRLTNKFRVGAQVKYCMQQLGENLMPKTNEIKSNEVSGLAYDFGTIFYPGFKSLQIGMSIQNFSPQYKYEEEAFELPLTFRIGAAMNLFEVVGGPSNSSLLLAVDALHPRDYTERLHMGAEYWFADLLAVRAGYKTNYDEESFSMGFGVKYSVGGIGLKVDYAYSDLGAFDGVNRITVGGTF